MTDTEAGRQAAHVLLDAISTFDSFAPGDESDRILNLAVGRLNEVGCVTAQYDDETDEAAVDASDLVGGTLVLLNGLIERIVILTGLPREVVVSQSREILDKSL